MNWFNKGRKPPADPELLEIVADLNSGVASNSKQARLTDWVEKHPEKRDEYEQLNTLFQELNICASSLTDEEVDAYLSEASVADAKAAPNRYLGMPVYAAAASVVAVLVLVFLITPVLQSDVQVYHTQHGERLVVNLEDDSVIHLNARTRVEVDYGSQQRTIRLVQGEGLFKVAHDPGRPFRVWTQNGVVEAIGTKFNINAVSGDVSVTVVEGTVLVSTDEVADKGAGNRQIGTVGQQIVLGPAGRLESSKEVELERVISWTQGKLIFAGESLEQVVRKISLHSKQNLALNDDRLEQLPIYGVFNMGDMAGFVSALKEAYPLDTVDVSARETLLFYKAKE